MKDKPHHFTYEQASEFLNMPRGTLYSLVHRKRIPHIRLSRRLVRFEESALRAWIAEHRIETMETMETNGEPADVSGNGSQA